MSDNSWKKFGKEDPYYAVITHEEYRSKNLNDQALDKFFSSGEEHVALLLQTFKNKLHLTNPAFKRVLDFGCGTGRLVIPFATRFEKVVGVDISQPMLDEAQKNLKARNITNVDLVQTDDITKLKFDTCFDLVHTTIVLQHIPTEQGYKIIDKMLSIVCEGGYGMIHFTFSNERSAIKNTFAALKNRFALTRGIYNVFRGKAFSTPVMQMNNYNLEKVFRMFKFYNLKQISVEFTDHSHLGMSVYFQK